MCAQLVYMDDVFILIFFFLDPRSPELKQRTERQPLIAVTSPRFVNSFQQSSSDDIILREYIQRSTTAI